MGRAARPLLLARLVRKSQRPYGFIRTSHNHWLGTGYIEHIKTNGSQYVKSDISKTRLHTCLTRPSQRHQFSMGSQRVKSNSLKTSVPPGCAKITIDSQLVAEFPHECKACREQLKRSLPHGPGIFSDRQMERQITWTRSRECHHLCWVICSSRLKGVQSIHSQLASFMGALEDPKNK